LHGRFSSADMQMSQPFGSSLTGDDEGRIDPYTLYQSQPQSAHGEGYMPARASSPTELLPFGPVSAHQNLNHYNNNNKNNNDESRRDKRVSRNGYASAGSYEPLMATFATKSATTPSPESGNGHIPPQPRRTSVGIVGRHSGSQSRSNSDIHKRLDFIAAPDQERSPSPQSEYSMDSIDYNDRLDPGLRLRPMAGGAGSVGSDPRDDRDYSRPVLAVRNMTELTDHSS
jgi:hypothetical protein